MELARGSPEPRSRSFGDKGIPKQELGNEEKLARGSSEPRSRSFGDKGIPKQELGNEEENEENEEKDGK